MLVIGIIGLHFMANHNENVFLQMNYPEILLSMFMALSMLLVMLSTEETGYLLDIASAMNGFLFISVLVGNSISAIDSYATHYLVVTLLVLVGFVTSIAASMRVDENKKAGGTLLTLFFVSMTAGIVVMAVW